MVKTYVGNWIDRAIAPLVKHLIDEYGPHHPSIPPHKVMEDRVSFSLVVNGDRTTVIFDETDDLILMMSFSKNKKGILIKQTPYGVCSFSEEAETEFDEDGEEGLSEEEVLVLFKEAEVERVGDEYHLSNVSPKRGVHIACFLFMEVAYPKKFVVPTKLIENLL